ncbi:24168_t:CDS:2 [Cetraspora pellucida]|uniref:24168_t:CDS:1 n=1 Tax=Cetraspora pellucida TaxID=1433469 RepID=A0A9N9EIF3_9GLOM|nr:24168_t:CDS:2 [Cetraspora pellucida]
MVTYKKKRFSLFNSHPNSPVQTPILGSPPKHYFPTQPIRDDKILNPSDVQKAVENLGNLISITGNFCDLVDKLAKASKALSKSLKEYGNSKEMDSSHVMCLQATSQFYENYSEAQNKSSKHLRKEFDTLQKFWEKYSKRVTKEEKAYENANELYKQIKKIDADEKKSKNNKATSDALEREKNAHGIIVQIICRIADCQFTLFTESLKKCGGLITKINEWSVFATMGIPAPQEIDNILDEIQSPTEDTSLLSRKLSRRYSHRISKSIASISDMQLAAMNYKSSDSSSPLIEEPENKFSQSLSFLRSTEIQFPRINATKSECSPIISTQHYEPTKRNIVKNEKKSRNRLSLPICPTFSSNSTPTAQDLISKISIGIDENDAPFFRDDDDYDIFNIHQSAKRLSVTESETKGLDDQVNEMSSIDNHTNLNIDTEIDIKIVSGVQSNDASDYEENENSNNKEINRKSSFETQYLVRSFPINLPVRTPPYSPSVSPRQASNSNCIIPNFEQQKLITKSNYELGPKKGIHVLHPSDGNINHNRGPSASNSVHNISPLKQGHVNNLLSRFDAGRSSKQEDIVNNSIHVNEPTKEICSTDRFEHSNQNLTPKQQQTATPINLSNDLSSMNESNKIGIINSLYSTFGTAFGKKKSFLQ